jgi:biotin carboxylase
MNTNYEKYIVIVDPFSTGALYAPIFRQRGYRCLAARSSASTPKHFASGFQPESFVEGRLFDIDEAVAYAGEQHIAGVVTGCEMAVAATDALAARLKLVGNSAGTSVRRREKYAMQEALREAGLRHIPSIFVKRKEDIAAVTAALTGIAYVVKPLNSAGTEGVRFCQGREGARAALEGAAWGAVNDLGEINQGFLVQPFVEGREYVVDMVAHAEGYTVASLCLYDKTRCNGSDFVYAGLDVLDPCDPQYAALISYAIEAAQALKIVIGPIHMELLWNDQGPVMIEAGARLHGGIAPALFNDCYLPTLLDLAVDAYIGRPILTQQCERIRYGRIVFLINDRAHPYQGVAEASEALLRQLPSYRGHKIFHVPGEVLPLTIDLATCPGIVWFAHHDAQQLGKDELVCRELKLI